jgi:hypothetical protein
MLPLFGTVDLETTITNLSLTVTTVGAILVVALLLLAIAIQKKVPKLKLPLFVAIVVVVLGTTFTIGGGTVYLNLNSATGGPVHWHADFEVWACGNELELRDPTGFSNKIGTPTYHEHNDKRVHLEGVPTSLPYDFSMGKFMSVIGGELTTDTLTVPLNTSKYFETAHGEQDGDGAGAPNPEQLDNFIRTTQEGKTATFTNGEACSGEPSQVQLFAYHYNEGDKTYKQTKIANPATYSPAHEANVPTGDCVIIEFAPLKERTDKLCKQYGVHDQLRCEAFGVPHNQRASVCDSKEVR